MNPRQNSPLSDLCNREGAITVFGFCLTLDTGGMTKCGRRSL